MSKEDMKKALAIIDECYKWTKQAREQETESDRPYTTNELGWALNVAIDRLRTEVGMMAD